MKDYEATETAYKNGYIKGKEEAKSKIVYCKDCMYWTEGEGGGYCDNPNGLNLNSDLTPNDYCSRGGKK